LFAVGVVAPGEFILSPQPRPAHASRDDV
jgi:hypothetical protein